MHQKAGHEIQYKMYLAFLNKKVLLWFQLIEQRDKMVTAGISYEIT